MYNVYFTQLGTPANFIKMYHNIKLHVIIRVLLKDVLYSTYVLYTHLRQKYLYTF